MNLLLDTCTFVWLVADPERLSPRVVQVVDDPGTTLTLSDVSVWELCLQWRNEKLDLPQPPRMWVAEQAEIWKLKDLRIKREQMFRETELADHHRDPFDRLLVAQALEERMVIATPDAAIQQYPVATLW